MDFWIATGSRLRASLKGWGANLGRQERSLREGIVAEITSLDHQADARPFSEQEWARRYALENQVQSLLRVEEEYWRCWGGLKWILKGDANTKYFHAYVNGRRRRCAILCLQSDQGLLLTQADIVHHIYDFYINLVGMSEEQRAGVRADLWDPSNTSRKGGISPGS